MGYYFTLDMLKVPFKVTQNVKGLDSDMLNEKGQLKTWFATNRPEKRKKRPNQKAKKRKKAIGSTRKRKTKAQRRLNLILSDDDACSCQSNTMAGADNKQLKKEKEIIPMETKTPKNRTTKAQNQNAKGGCQS
jgi:hypothetical protein